MKDVIMIQSNIPKKLETPNELGKKAREALSESINPLIADAFALYVKTKNFHWHVAGSHYRDYHLLLDEQADQIFAMIDPLAERVRKVGGVTIRSIEHIKTLQRIQDDNDAFVKATDMLHRLMEDNKKLVVEMRETHKICDEYNDVATASILENYIDETERRIWFLYETLAE